MTLPDDVVERVTRAIALAEYNFTDGNVMPKWSEWRDHARAALEAARYGELVGEVREFLPRNVCLTNRNVPDATFIPLECTMGDLRRIAALLSSIGAA